jgi:hypothetical protein
VGTFFAFTLLLTGCGGGEQTTGDAPALSPEATKANDAYVNQYAKEAMKDKSKEKPASSKATPGAAPGPGSN